MSCDTSTSTAPPTNNKESSATEGSPTLVSTCTTNQPADDKNAAAEQSTNSLNTTCTTSADEATINSGELIMSHDKIEVKTEPSALSNATTSTSGEKTLAQKVTRATSDHLGRKELQVRFNDNIDEIKPTEMQKTSQDDTAHMYSNIIVLNVNDKPSTDPTVPDATDGAPLPPIASIDTTNTLGDDSGTSKMESASSLAKESV